MKLALGIAGLLFVGFLVVAGSVGMWAVGTYNSIVTKNEGVSQSWSQVQNVYQRRTDLIPNIVATAGAAAKFEKSTFVEIAAARASVGQFKVDSSIVNNPAQFAKFQQAQGFLGQALGKLMVIKENYPELKANKNFENVMIELEGTENRIAVERKTFNETAQDFNTTIKVFPGSFVAGFGHFQPKAYFEAEQQAQTAPKVNFGN